MKASSKIHLLCLWLIAAVLVAGFEQRAPAQPVLNVSPAVISNAYAGVITLQISGLTNGETVNVLAFLDLNSNGVVDVGEPLMDAFTITDNGTNGIYGSVTNVNIPIDRNPAGGAITLTLNIAPPLTLGNIVGQQIYEVVSPGGRFTPVTATLQITNAATAQSVTGTVFDGGSPFPNAVVVALLLPNTDYAGSAVADNAGHYALNLNPGNYVLLTALPGYYTDQSLAPQVTLTNGVIATNNLFLTNGDPASTISGRVYDSASSNGLGGVFVQLQSGNLFTVTFTDTNGGYAAAVTPGFWKIQAGKERLPRRAYVVSQNNLQVDATAGSVSNADVAVYPANALFYGRITDNGGAPLPNVIFDANDNNNQFSAKGYSDPDGDYAVAVVAMTNDSWYCNANSSEELLSYILNNFNNADLSAGQLVRQDFVALLITAHISGQVHDNTGQPVNGVTMFASTSGGAYQSLDANTDGSGYYSLGVASGSWFVNFSDGGEGGLSTAGFVDLFGPHAVSVPPTNVVLNLTVYPLGTPLISSPQRISPTQFGFTVNGASNVSYTVQVSTNLASTNWGTLFSLTLTNTAVPVVDPNATNSRRFYRVKKN